MACSADRCMPTHDAECKQQAYNMMIQVKGVSDQPCLAIQHDAVAHKVCAHSCQADRQQLGRKRRILQYLCISSALWSHAGWPTTTGACMFMNTRLVRMASHLSPGTPTFNVTALIEKMTSEQRHGGY